MSARRYSVVRKKSQTWNKGGVDRAISLVQLHTLRTKHGAWNTQGIEATARKPLDSGVLGGGDSLDKGGEMEGTKLGNYKKISLAKAGRFIRRHSWGYKGKPAQGFKFQMTELWILDVNLNPLAVTFSSV